MKALKEKRLSLRSFLRRGLVILSLFALVFASCNQSGGDDNGDNGGGGGGGGGVPAGPTVVSITILKQPDVESFQGCAPDLSGILAEIVWSDNNREIIGADSGKFYTLPGYCDEASYTTAAWSQNADGTVNNGGKKMALGYLGQQVVSTDLIIPWVVAASSLQITGNAPTDWYADERPDFTGLAYEVIYNEGWITYEQAKTGGTTSVTAGSSNVTANPKDAGKYKKIAQTMTSTYPFTDFKDVKDQKKVIAYINANGTRIESSFGITNYYEVSGIEFAGGDSWVTYYDDDLGKFYDFNASGVNTGISIDKIKDEFKKSGVKFNVFYFGGKTRTITMNQFIANDSWYRSSGLGSGGTWMSGTASSAVLISPTSTYGVASNQSYNTYKTPIYNYDEDDQTWPVTLDYSPARFNGDATLGAVIVEVPIWVWSEDMTRNRKANTGSTNPLIWGAASGALRSLGTGPSGETELDAIQAKWELSATYENGRATTKRAMDISAQMIYDGYSMALGNRSTGGSVFNPNNAYTEFLSMPGVTASGLTSGMIGRNWPLPIYYRGVTLYDEDESPLLDILGGR